MPDLFDLRLPHSDLPEYDYDRYAAMGDEEAGRIRIGNPFESRPFDRSPADIKADGPVAELLAQ